MFYHLSSDYLKLATEAEVLIWLADISVLMDWINIFTLGGIILLGFGLALQGWFILDMNRRFSKLLGQLIINNQEKK